MMARGSEGIICRKLWKQMNSSFCLVSVTHGCIEKCLGDKRFRMFGAG